MLKRPIRRGNVILTAKINIKRRDGFIESSDEESFYGYSEEEEEDEFIVIVDDDERRKRRVDGEMIADSKVKGGWDEDMEDSDDESDFVVVRKRSTRLHI